MAIYSFSCKAITAKKGRSSVGAAAYIAGEKLKNERDGITHDYTRKQGIEYSEIVLPQNAPEEYQDRETLWNAVEKIDGSDQRTAREFIAALPRELSRAEQIKVVQDFCAENLVSRGMCVDFSIHDTGDGNPHAHIMTTMRAIQENGEWDYKYKTAYPCRNHEGQERVMLADELKERKAEGWEKLLPYYEGGTKKGHKLYLTKYEAENDPKYKDYERVKGQSQPRKENIENPKSAAWNDKESLQEWRAAWAAVNNRELAKRGIEPIDHRSHADRGILKIPTIHLGAAASMEKKGKETDRGNINREARAANMAFDKELDFITQEVQQLRREAAANEQRQKQAAELEAARQRAAQESQQNRERQEKEQAPAPAREGREQERQEPKAPTTTPAHATKAGADLREGEPRQPSPESMGQTLSDTKARYMETLEQTERVQSNFSKHGDTARRAQQDAQDIQNRTKAIDGMQRQINQLQNRRAELGMFSRQEKRSIDNQVASLEHSKQQAAAALKQTHGITPEQAPAKVQKLQQQGREASRQQESQRPALEQLKQTRQELALTYKQTKVMADLQPEKVRAQIEAAEQKADKARETAAPAQSQQGGKMSIGQIKQRITAERELRTISPKEYPSIKASLPPAAQKQLETRDKGAQAPSYAKGTQTQTQGRTGPTGPRRGGIDR